MNMATPTSPTKELMEGIRVKRLPAYLRSQLQNAMDQFPDDPATNLIIQSLTLALDSEDEFNSKIDKLTELLQSAYKESNTRQTQFIYEFLLYFSNIHPKQTYPSDDVNIPSEYRIISSCQYCFDIRELIANSKIRSAQLINPINDQAFFPLDQKRIFNMAYALGLEFQKETQQGLTDQYAGFDPTRYKIITRNGYIIDFNEIEISGNTGCNRLRLHEPRR